MTATRPHGDYYPGGRPYPTDADQRDFAPLIVPGDKSPAAAAALILSCGIGLLRSKPIDALVEGTLFTDFDIQEADNRDRDRRHKAI